MYCTECGCLHQFDKFRVLEKADFQCQWCWNHFIINDKKYIAKHFDFCPKGPRIGDEVEFCSCVGCRCSSAPSFSKHFRDRYQPSPPPPRRRYQFREARRPRHMDIWFPRYWSPRQMAQAYERTGFEHRILGSSSTPEIRLFPDGNAIGNPPAENWD